MMLVPPPTKVSNKIDEQEMQKIVVSVPNEARVGFVTAFYRGESGEEIIERGLTSDGVHYTDERFCYILSKVLDR